MSSNRAERGGGRGEDRGRGRGRGRSSIFRNNAAPPPPTRQAATNAPPLHTSATTTILTAERLSIKSLVAVNKPQSVSEASGQKLAVAVTLPPASATTAISTAGLTFGSISFDVDRLSIKTPVAVTRPPQSFSEASGQKLAVAMTLPPESSKDLRPPQRPGYGTIGENCLVRVNHFLVEVADKDLHRYDVRITPEVPKFINRAVIGQLVNLYKESNLSSKTPAYDGMNSIFTAGPLPFASKEFAVELDEKDGGKSATWPQRQFKVGIEFAAKVSMYNLQEFLQRRQRVAPQDTIRALNVILRQLPSKNFSSVGRSFFHRSLGRATIPGDGFEYWTGYFQSIRPTQMGLSLNIDVSARGFYEPILVPKFIAKYCVEDIRRPLSDEDLIKVEQALKGIKVEVTYGEHTRNYKVTGITNQMTKNLEFPMGEAGTPTSVVKFYRDRYKLPLRYDWLPCIQAGSEKKRLYLPMEICRIVQGQHFSKRMNVKQVSNLLKSNCQRPYVREIKIQEMVAKDHFSDTFVIDEFGIKVNTQLNTVEARVLPPPALQYHGSLCNPQMGQWNMIGKKMFNAGTVQNWACVSFSAIEKDFVYNFCQALIDMCRKKGMVVDGSPVIPLISANPSRIESTLADMHTHCSEKKIHILLLLIVLPDTSGSYGTIKRVCETELGIVSQCCQPKEVVKRDNQYLANVVMKINVKVGGQNVVLADALAKSIPLVSDAPTIIFGADVTHPGQGEDSSPSIAAVVASMDWPEVTKYRGLISYQGHGVEIIQDLYSIVQDPPEGHKHGGMIRDHLMAFRRSTNLIPQRIIFYRDGVGEGQFGQVLFDEVDAIRKACASLQDGYMPPVTFVVVQKRHHTRFFPVKTKMADKSGNVLAGTVVDQGICHPTEFDFYLNSHMGIKGTSRPAHYHVLFDENNVSADQLQSLTNNLCYTYARCTKSLSIVPPAYYAHLLAFRARYYVEGSDFSGSGSCVGRSATGAQGNVRHLPKILNNVQNVMFYC